MILKTLRKLSLVILTLLFSFLISCTRDAKSERKVNKLHKNGKITIGAAAPWNELKEDKILLKEGIILAVDEINKTGGINGCPIEIIWKDDYGTVKQGKIIAEEFAADPDVIAVIGHYNSAVSIAASIVYEYAGILMITPCSTTSELTTRDKNRLTFQNIPSGDVFAKKLAYYIANTGFANKIFVNSILIYNEDSLYANELAAAFEKYIVSHRIKVVDRRLFYPDSNRLFFRDDIEHVDSIYKFDAVFISGLGEKTCVLIDEVRKLGLKIPVFCGEGVTGKELIEILGIDANGTVYCSTYDPSVKTAEMLAFKKRFLNNYKCEPDSLAVQGYNTVMVLAAAIKKAASTNPVDISAALKKINYKSLTGNISFTASGKLKNAEVIIKKIENEKIVIIDNSSYKLGDTHEDKK